MKNNHCLSYFFILLILLSSYYSLSIKNNSTIKIEKAPISKPFFQGYFFLQTFYPGLDALQNIIYSSTKPSLKYFTLLNNLLYYSESINDPNKIKGIFYINLAGININKILDKMSDSPSQGKCCENIKYINYLKSSETNPKTAPIFKKEQFSSKFSYKKANYCVEIFVPFEARWLLCSKTLIDIYRFHLKLVFSLIKFNVNMNKVDSTKIMDKFLSNTKLTSLTSSNQWSWTTQNKWEGKCSSKFMQSPIEIHQGNTIIPSKNNLKFYYQILNTNVEVVRRFNEIVVKFQNDPGLFMIELGKKRIVYEPKFISFRFPGQQLINGKKFPGEMLINCKELNLKKNKISKGLILTIPLETSPTYTNFELIESLSMDFWKFMVLKNGKYQPRNFITKKRMVFKMKNIIDHISKQKSFYYLYLGSQDTPPCQEFTYHIVVEKPIKLFGCQLKVLRENSLATSEETAVHSRLMQVNRPNLYDHDKMSSGVLDDIDSNIDLGDYGREEKVILMTTMIPHIDLYRYVPKESITSMKKHKEIIKKKKKKILKKMKKNKPNQSFSPNLNC